MKKITPILLLFFACQPQTNYESKRKEIVEEKAIDRIYSFMNEELPPKVLTDESRLLFERNLEVAKTNLDEHPDSLDLIIWHGRRLAYLGQYLEAIDVFSEGIKNYPSSHRLRRHRGHRYITIRQIDKAISDFELAAYNSISMPNAVEPDGLPNKMNQPVGNDKFNIWYHFGLAYYLNGRYDKALSAYNKCLEFSDNNDLLVATTYWQYLTLRKLGNIELASNTLTTINGPMKLVENDTYLDLLLLYKGEKDVSQLQKQATGKDGKLNPTLAYGIGSYYQHEGKLDQANELFLSILDSPNWDAFGYIAAEAELTTIFPTPRSGS